jgi:hypothetical protein
MSEDPLRLALSVSTGWPVVEHVVAEGSQAGLGRKAEVSETVGSPAPQPEQVLVAAKAE